MTVIKHLKARWVGKGYVQRLGIDYITTSLTVVLKLPIPWMDQIAFLNAKSDVELYLEHLQGFVNAVWPMHVCCMLKSLYSLKQAPLEWYCPI